MVNDIIDNESKEDALVPTVRAEKCEVDEKFLEKDMSLEQRQKFICTTPSTCFDFALRLGMRIGDMASQYEAPTWDASNRHYDSETYKRASSNDTGTSKLEEEFCIEVSHNTFQLLHNLLEEFLENKHENIAFERRCIAASLIKVVEVNLHRLVKSNVSPEKIGIAIPKINAKFDDLSSDMKSRGTFANVLELLMKIIEPNNSKYFQGLQHEAAAAIDAGFDVLFPSRLERVLLLIKLVRHQIKNPVSSASARRQLLDRLMWRFASKSSGAVNMIPTPGDSNDHSKAVLELVTMLLKVATDDSSNEANSSSESGMAVVEEDLFDVDSNTEMANHFNNILSTSEGLREPPSIRQGASISQRDRVGRNARRGNDIERGNVQREIEGLMDDALSSLHNETRAVENIVTPNSDTSDRRSGGRDGNVRWVALQGSSSRNLHSRQYSRRVNSRHIGSTSLNSTRIPHRYEHRGRYGRTRIEENNDGNRTPVHNVSISSNMDAPTLRSEPNEGNGGAKKGIQKNKPNVNKNELKTRSFHLSALQLLASYQRHLVSAAATPLPIKSNIPTADGKFLKRKISRASSIKKEIVFAPKNVSFAFKNPSATTLCQSNSKNEVSLGPDRVLKCAACDGAFSASDAGIPETLSIGKGGDEICDKDGNCRPVFCLVCEEKSRATAQDHLLTYVKALCRFSCSRLDSVNSIGAKDDTSTLLLLRRSIIGTLVPPLASALALLSHQHALVEEISTSIHSSN